MQTNMLHVEDILKTYFLNLSIVSTLYSCFTYMFCSQRLEEGDRSPGTSVIDSCKSLCEYREQNWSPLSEETVIRTTKLLF